jgi:hypothetical protein
LASHATTNLYETQNGVTEMLDKFHWFWISKDYHTDWSKGDILIRRVGCGSLAWAVILLAYLM